MDFSAGVRLPPRVYTPGTGSSVCANHSAAVAANCCARYVLVYYTGTWYGIPGLLIYLVDANDSLPLDEYLVGVNL